MSAAPIPIESRSHNSNTTNSLTAEPLALHPAASKGFGTEESTSAYERGRPTYDEDAVDQLIMAGLKNFHGKVEEINVVEVGAGTGKFTRVLQSRLNSYIEKNSTNNTGIQRYRLIAIEPVPAMCNAFRQSTPGIEIITSSADSIPLPSKSIHLVVCAQAFHWFSTIAAVTEFHRLLITGGSVCLIWNSRNTDYNWVKVVESIIDSYYSPDVPRQQTGQFKKVFLEKNVLPLFTPLESAHYIDKIIQEGNRDLQIDRIFSISVISCLNQEEKDLLKKRLYEIWDNEPDTKGKELIKLPYRTDVYWSYKL